MTHVQGHPGPSGGGGHGSGQGQRAFLAQILRNYGLRPADFENIIERAIRRNWSPETFEAMIYGSRPFKERFRGIFENDGSLRMSPLEYIELEKTYEEIARDHGFFKQVNSSREIARLIEGNVSAQEFEDRLVAAERMQEFAPAFEAFKKVVKHNFGETLGDKEIFDFVLGMGDKKFYDIWERAGIQEQAKAAGVKLDQSQIAKIAKSQAGYQDPSQYEPRFAELAQKIKTVMPLSQMSKWGISKQDLIELEFPGSTTNGEKRKTTAMKIERLLKGYEAKHDQGRQARTGEVSQQRGRLGY